MNEVWDTGRTEAFSDAVLAIAITLLVLEISVPEAAFDDLRRAIVEEWPSYLAYATSFLTIGAIWAAHHGIFRRLQYANKHLMLVNLVLLMLVAFLPFPTKLMAEAVGDRDATRAAVIFYGAVLLAISLLLRLMWSLAARDRRLLQPEVTDEEISEITRSTTPSIALYGVVIALAVVVPAVAVFSYLVIASLALLRMHGDRTP